MNGDAGFSTRAHMRLALLTLAVLVLGFGSWAVFARISGAVIGSGHLEVEQQRQIVQHPEGGVVEEIFVTEGGLVEAGAPLMRLDGARLKSELTVVETRFFELLARRARLEAERDDAPEITFPPELEEVVATRPDLAVQISAQMRGQERLLEARRETTAGIILQLDQRRTQIDAQVEGITAQLDALDRQVALVAEERETQSDLLQRGLAQAARVLALDREAARLDGSRGALLSERASAAERRAEIGQQILSLEAQRREEAQSALREISSQELELAERRRALSEQIDRLELRAPVSGIVYGMQVTTPRAVLRPADPALYIVPQDRPLVIAARVDPAQIDQVALGQQAVVFFPGLNMRELPQLFAEVVQISADAFTDQALGLSYYRVELVLEAESFEALGTRALLPGMPVEVFLQTGMRSPMSYLTRPLTDYFSRAMRES